MKTRRTWREKLEKGQEPEVVDHPPGRGRMLIPKALDVDGLIRQIQRGKLATISQIRGRLAKDFHAYFTCTMTAGIFLRIAAETAEEDLSRGKEEATPYWRVIKEDGSLNEKVPGGAAAQAVHSMEEGHAIQPGEGKGLPRVEEFKRSLQDL